MGLLQKFTLRLQNKNSDSKSTATVATTPVEHSHTRPIALAGRKKQSLAFSDSSGGVFVSTRNLFPAAKDNDSASSYSDADESVSSSLSSSQSSTQSSSPSRCTSPPASWKSSGRTDHHKNCPLVVTSPDQPDHVILDEAAELGRIMARSRNLPGTWYYSSNHILVNQERTQRTVAPLMRMRELDEMAREQAEAMAAENRLFHHRDPAQLHVQLNRPARRLGENVAVGTSIREMHKNMMNNLSDRNNIVDRRYTHMGMATARGADGRLYLCQIFRG